MFYFILHKIYFFILFYIKFLCVYFILYQTQIYFILLSIKPQKLHLPEIDISISESYTGNIFFSVRGIIFHPWLSPHNGRKIHLPYRVGKYYSSLKSNRHKILCRVKKNREDCGKIQGAICILSDRGGVGMAMAKSKEYVFCVSSSFFNIFDQGRSWDFGSPKQTEKKWHS